MVVAEVTLREDAIVCGTDWFNETFHQRDPSAKVEWRYKDGDRPGSNSIVCTVTGPAQAILSGERTALNFLQILSGTATVTAEFVDAIAGTGAVILDTRKTVPGLRTAQKYAVRCGGGSNHRAGLFDAILIKENHILAMGSIDAAINEALHSAGTMMIEVEVETMEQTEQAMASEADRLLLDNFSLEQMREAAEMRDRLDKRKKLEASGGITIDNVRAIAETGVDFVSVGVLTKNVRAVDYSLRIV